MEKIIVSCLGENVGQMFIRHRAIFNKVFRYGVSGVSAAAVSLAVLYLTTDILGFWYLYGSVLGFLCGLAVSFILQKLWTFGNGETRLRAVAPQFGWYFFASRFLIPKNEIRLSHGKRQKIFL
jgi:putative flippase GtrA